ncbi:DNA-binding bromodomain-containing protein [Striga asiatica]|uniref:DNA-binding bromodomain-containing protein n=1 Tax=Striga asiatica TaxID=4170 RepID=A0A5A7QMR3_STRAF|nr:DNA-binding bromodomain-containing protein [Striga asiatica]
MMEQIVKRKKKGRPPKADPPPPPPQQQPENDLRRSLRRRNVKYVFDLDDYFDEDDLFTDDENRSRREKKLEQLLKLQSGGESESTAPQRTRFRRVYHAPAASASSSDDDDKPSKKRRINGYLDRDSDDDNDYTNDEDNCNGEEEEEDDEEEEAEIRARKRDPQAEESSPPAEFVSLNVIGTPAERPSGLPLPDKRALELILDKLQKKDIYGVYAEPVDPEELPDYHDIIEHPMDFATVRNKLGNGSYATFEQFERDVFLICSNAMQYNALDTVYYKHARTIQELAKRKFEKIKLKMECMEKKDFKPEQKSRSASTLKKQIKSPIGRQMVQEPVGSDFSSGATLATAGDDHTVSNALQQPDIVDGPAEDNSFGNDSNLDKMEESLPGKGQVSRIGRKPFLPDENRRATYAISLSEAVVSPDSIFSTFDGETKHLVPVGLYADHSYARSLAHFAATLGSVAWRVASKRIEEALPQGFKFGHGWVGEYEPLPTPVLMLKNRPIKEPPYFAKVQPTAHPKTLENRPSNLISESQTAMPLSEHKLPCFNLPVSKTPAPVITVPTVGNNIPEKKAPFFLSPGAHLNGLHSQSFQSRDFSGTNKNSFPKHIESNGVPWVHKNSANLISSRQIPRTSETEASRSPKNKSFPPPEPFKQPDASWPVSQRVPDRKIANNYQLDGNTAVSYYPHHDPGPGLSDPAQQMRQLSEKARQNHKLPNQSSPNAPQMLSQSLKFAGNDSNNAALSAARAWMSVGSFRPPSENVKKINSGSFNNSTPREMQSQAWRFQGEKNISPVYGFVGQGQMPVMVGGGNQMVQLQNQRLVFPQLAGSDLMMHSPAWLRQKKQENFPPDLNIGFQSSGSPVQPSSGVLLDSQQPDLALQL